MGETGTRRRFRKPSAILAPIFSLSLLQPWEAEAFRGDCGQPFSQGETPVVSDCLFLLRAAVLATPCEPFCICDVDASGGPPTASDALSCLNAVVAGEVMAACDCRDVPPTSTTTLSPSTTTTIGSGSACPDTAETTWHARIGPPCALDADCAPGACDADLGRCKTLTELDLGWTGLSHDLDWNGGQRVLLRTVCDAKSAPCGACSIAGVDPSDGACRCRSDNRLKCGGPAASDLDVCGGAACDCYLGAPLPLSVAKTPICAVNRFGADVTGSVDFDAGSSVVDYDLRTVVYRGDVFNVPCPHCRDDVRAGDGMRDGICESGKNAGLPCDVDAENSSFPAPGGGGYSLDCFPDEGKNVSGAGLALRREHATGAASLTAGVDCTTFGIPATCHCGVCSLAGQLACADDADCVAHSAGVCQKHGIADPRPDGCTDGAVCSGDPAADSECDGVPIDRTCDGLLRADGSGLVSCVSNDDCSETTLGIDAGNCTLTTPRECFQPTIEAGGTPDPVAPVVVGIACVPPLSSAGLNAVFGLPGPMRLRVQQTLRGFCGGPAGREYVAQAGCASPSP